MNKSSVNLYDIARTARVPDANHALFVRLIAHEIGTAQIESLRPVGKNISAGALDRGFFDPVVRAAKELRTGLGRLQGENLAPKEGARSMVAHHFFSEALQSLSQSEDAADATAHFLHSLDLGLVIAVAERASERAKRWLPKAGRKKGTGSTVFDIFVMGLLQASERAGGRLTIYKTAYAEDYWTGTLLKAVQQLRPMLPKANFFPAGKLGYALHTVYRRWRSETGKSRRKKG